MRFVKNQRHCAQAPDQGRGRPWSRVRVRTTRLARLHPCREATRRELHTWRRRGRDGVSTAPGRRIAKSPGRPTAFGQGNRSPLSPTLFSRHERTCMDATQNASAFFRQFGAMWSSTVAYPASRLRRFTLAAGPYGDARTGSESDTRALKLSVRVPVFPIPSL